MGIKLRWMLSNRLSRQKPLLHSQLRLQHLPHHHHQVTELIIHDRNVFFKMALIRLCLCMKVPPGVDLDTARLCTLCHLAPSFKHPQGTPFDALSRL